MCIEKVALWGTKFAKITHEEIARARACVCFALYVENCEITTL